MNNEQISALWKAAQEAGLTAEQIRGLSISNPYTQRGPTAQRIQSALARTAPAIAQQMLAESGAEMSLQAKAAQLGLAEMTNDLQAEIAAFSPVTPEQARFDRVQEILAQEPGGRAGYYNEAGDFVAPKQSNATLMMELSALDSASFQREELHRKPPTPAEGAITQEGADFINARLASMNAAQGVG